MGGVQVQTDVQRTKVTVGCKNSITSLDPFISPNPFTDAILGQIFMWLAMREDSAAAQMTGMLARSWSTEDGKSYSFELYEGIVDTAGNPFTSDDVAFCFEKAKAGGIAAAGYVEKVEIVDDTHFNLVLTRDSVGTLEQVCENVLMCTREAYEASPDGMATAPVGMTHYKLKDYAAGSYIVLEKTDSFWMDAYEVPKLCEANVDVIEYQFLTEVTQMKLALLQDNVQMAIQVDNSLVAELEADENYDVAMAPAGTFRYLVFNMTDESPLKNKALREAICYAIDSQGLNIAVLEGLSISSVSFWQMA